MIYNILLCVALSIIFLRPSVNVAAVPIEYVAGLPLLWFALHQKWPRRDVAVLGLWVVALAYAILILLIYGSTDFEAVRRLSRTCIDVIVALSLFRLIRTRYGDEAGRVVYSVVLYSAVVQALIMVGMYTSPTIDSLVSRVIVQDDGLVFSGRISGLQSHGGDGLSLNQCLGALAGWFLYLRARRSHYALLATFVALTSVLAGRSGLFVLILIACVGWVRAILSNKTRLVHYVVPAVIVIAAAMAAPTLISRAQDTSLGYQDPVYRALEPVRQYVSTGVIRTSSTSAIAERMLFLPEGARLIFGNSEYGREGVEYIASDVGYVRIIHGAGLLGLLLITAPFLYAWYSIDSCAREYEYMLLFGVVANAKIVYLITGAFVTTLVLCYSLSHITQARSIARAGG